MKTRHSSLPMMLLAAGCLLTSAAASAQDISQIGKSDPLIISGAVGTNNTFYRSSMGSAYATPFSSTFYASLNISVYGFNMPFSVYYSSNNISFTHPTFSFNMSPSFKNWTLHFGESSMVYSNYVMSMPFNGLGVEYSGDKLRFGAFYGTLKKAINDNPDDPTARTPQYERIGWGAKVGYGSSSTYLDLYFLRAQDRLSSLLDAWQTQLAAQEDVVVGAKGRFGIGNHFSMQANVAGTLFNDDIAGVKALQQMVDDRLSTNDTLRALGRWDDAFSARNTAMARFAGDVSMSFNMGSFSSALYYKLIQPQYKSLGLSYLSNNMQCLGLSASGSLFRKISLSANFSGQQDNLSKEQLYTTKGFVYSAGAAFSMGTRGNISVGYSGYRQLQDDGAVPVPDSIRANRIMHSLSVTPSFSLEGDNVSHNFTPSFSWNMNGDLNPYTNADGSTDVRTLAAGLGYALNLQKIETTISTNYSHQQSRGYNTCYSTDLFSFGTSRSFLAEKNLDVSINANLVSNRVKDQSSNLSLGFDASVGYTLKEAHVFSFSAGYNKYNNINFTDTDLESGDPFAYRGYDLTMSLNYSYTFTLLQIKRRAKDAEGGNPAMND